MFVILLRNKRIAYVKYNEAPLTAFYTPQFRISHISRLVSASFRLANRRKRVIESRTMALSQFSIASFDALRLKFFPLHSSSTHFFFGAHALTSININFALICDIHTLRPSSSSLFMGFYCFV